MNKCARCCGNSPFIIQKIEKEKKETSYLAQLSSFNSVYRATDQRQKHRKQFSAILLQLFDHVFAALSRCCRVCNEKLRKREERERRKKLNNTNVRGGVGRY